MQTLILDGSFKDDPIAAQISSALRAQLPDAETIAVCEQKIGNCAGDFFCWVRSPGLCNTNDDNRIIAEKIMHSDLVINLTPITFGGYSSVLKRMVDHEIQNILPFFATINGEIHHQRRYRHYPNTLTIGWTDSPDAQAEAVFRHLVHRNALNMYSSTAICGIVDSTLDVDTQLFGWLDAVRRKESTPVPALPTMDDFSAAAAPVQRAVLLVGSPRTQKSTSASLGGYLMDQLSARGIEAETVQVYTSFNSAERTRLTLEKLDAADLVVLAFPLYVDSLPAPVIAALEKIAAYRASVKVTQGFAAIVNCGFPEVQHNDTALTICAHFARQAGMTWLGSLALGGGEGIVHGMPLNEMDGRAIPLKKALDFAAESLADGRPIPGSARDLMAGPVIPHWLYRFVGIFGWKRWAREYGAEKSLKAQPYKVSR